VPFLVIRRLVQKPQIFKTPPVIIEFQRVARFFYFILVIKPQKTCGPQFAQQICQFVTGSKRCGKEVKRKKRRKRSGQLNRGQSKTVSKALSSKN
jgi:hypothetical protein